MDTTGVRQRWALGVGVVVGIGVGLVGATVALATTSPTYESTASVLVQQIGSTTPILLTEAQLARSTRTATDAARTVGRSTEDLAAATTVVPVEGSSVLLITVRAESPTAAQAGARAVASSYLANRAVTARAAIQDQVTSLTARISDTYQQAATLNTQMARMPANSPELAVLRNSATVLASQLTTMSTRLTDLQTTPIDPGQVIGDPTLPTAAVSPRPWLYRALGALAGALLGLVAALARRRLTRPGRGAPAPAAATGPRRRRPRPARGRGAGARRDRAARPADVQPSPQRDHRFPGYGRPGAARHGRDAWRGVHIGRRQPGRRLRPGR